MPHLIFIKSPGHISGPQPQSVTETTKIQANVGSTMTFDYQVHVNTQSLTEANKVQVASMSFTFNYA